MGSCIIAVGTDKSGNVWEDHFGVAPFYGIYNEEGVLMETRKNPYAPTAENPQYHGKPELIAKLLPECSVWMGRYLGSRKPFMDEKNIITQMTMEDGAEDAVKSYISTLQHA